MPYELILVSIFVVCSEGQIQDVAHANKHTLVVVVVVVYLLGEKVSQCSHY